MHSSWPSRLVARLGKIKGELSEIADELRDERDPYLKTQLSRLDLVQGGLKLNLGSGNVDVPPADVEMHLSWGLPFSDEAVSYCYLSHVLEHFYRQEAVELLREIYRVLQGGGVARILVPDIEKCMQAYVKHDQGYFETRRKLWSVSSKSAATPLEMVLKNAGAAVKPGSLWGHKHGYDFETLSQVLGEAGFKYIERSDYMTSAYDDLRLDDVSRVAGNEHAEMKFSMFVEARK
jgi:SAM-dependent methyltransferase